MTGPIGPRAVRNLSPDQKRELARKQREIAKRLRESDAKKWTNAKVGAVLGVDGDTVGNWLNRGSNPKPRNTSVPDARVKIPAEKRAKVAREVKKKGVAQVAADYGVSERQVRNIVAKEHEQQSAKAKREATVKKLGGDTLGIHHGDFRKLANLVPDGSVDLIFTDLPYDAESVPLYGDLARFAATKLKPGGWCLTYAGQSFLPQQLAEFSKWPLVYAWTFAVLHSGGDLRFRKYKLQNGWKPILGFIRPPVATPWWDWFKDVASGGKEKDEHEWQQAGSEAAHFMGALCPVRGLVCDPSERTA